MLQLFISLMTLPRERDEKGASAVEYGLLVAGVAAAVLVAVLAMEGILDGVFDSITTAINGGGDGS